MQNRKRSEEKQQLHYQKESGTASIGMFQILGLSILTVCTQQRLDRSSPHYSSALECPDTFYFLYRKSEKPADPNGTVPPKLEKTTLDNATLSANAVNLV